MTKQTFRESMRENNAKFKKDMKVNKEKTRSDSDKLIGEWNEKKTEYAAAKAETQTVKPVGVARMKNTMVKGFALWLAIPAIVVIIIVGLFVVVGLWDWVIGIFS